MKKSVLIVDDSELNVALIYELIQKYSEVKEVELDIFTATNGQEAVDICDVHSIDLIFMDLMMPTMDGIEATKKIKEKDSSIMVIVVSSVGNEKQQKEMLLNGAEDYIVKPLIASVFKARLHNYLQVVENRNHIGISPKAFNIFTPKVYSYHMSFSIFSEKDLSEFWEAMLIRFDFQKQIDGLSDLVRFIYILGTFQLQHKFNFHIVVEEDLDNFYYTLDKMQFIGSERIEKLIEKYYKDALYAKKENKVTFTLVKRPIEELEPQTPLSEATTVQETQEIAEDVLVYKTVENEACEVYDILDEDDLSDLESSLSKINSIVLLMENASITPEEAQELCSHFNAISSILSVVNGTYEIANSLYELSETILSNMSYFSENSGVLFEFTHAFVNDLIFWKTKIFYEGAPSLNFLNDSITTNANMLKALLKVDDAADATVDMDDIFDF